MSTITVQYHLSLAAQRRIAIATGDEPAVAQQLVLDLAPLTPDQRAALLDARGSQGGITIVQVQAKTYPDSSAWYETRSELDDRLETVEDVLAALADMAAAKAAAEAEQARLRTARNAALIADARAYLAGVEKPGSLLSARVWSDAPGAEEVAELLAAVQAEDVRRVQMRAAEIEAEKATKEAQRQAEHAERLAWARQHGSAQLRRGLEAGHTCTRLYVIERAAHEYPGYVVDYNDTAD